MLGTRAGGMPVIVEVTRLDILHRDQVGCIFSLGFSLSFGLIGLTRLGAFILFSRLIGLVVTILARILHLFEQGGEGLVVHAFKA